MNIMEISNPKEWSFRAAIYQYEVSEEYAEIGEMIISDVLMENDSADIILWNRDQALNFATEGSRYSIKQTCDHCGARFNYGAAYENEKTGECIVVGNVCATTHMLLTKHQVADKLLRRKVKAARTKAENILKIESLDEPLRSAMKSEHHIATSIRRYFLKYGEISDSQNELILKIHNNIQKENERIKYHGHIGLPKERLILNVECIKSTGFIRPVYYGDDTEFVNVTTLVTKCNKLVVVKSPLWRADKGDKLKIKATVKSHDNYRGDDQTIVQRVVVL